MEWPQIPNFLIAIQYDYTSGENLGLNVPFLFSESTKHASHKPTYGTKSTINLIIKL